MTILHEVKFDTCKRFADDDFKEAVFSFQIPRTNVKEVPVTVQEDVKDTKI